MSLQTRLSDFITAVGTDYKQLRTWVTGSSTGSLLSLTTTDKTSLLAAVNEVNAKVAPAPAAASESTAGIMQIATQVETNAGVADNDAVSPLKLQTRLAAYAQPKSTNLTALDIASSSYGRGFLSLVDQVGLMGLVRAATETVTGSSRFATQAETNTGTADTVAVTPLKFQTRLAAFAQPLSSNLSTLAGVVSGAFGRSLLTSADAASARTSLGLATIATTGSASDITGGTLPSSVMPPLAITDVFVVATQAAMLALVAQRGDVAKRTDTSRTYILSTDDATLLANWIEVTANGDVTSVAGRTGAITLTKTDVGLASVDNTADSAKPVSTAQQNAIDLRLLKSANLSDLASAVTARANLSVYSQAEIGNPETDLVAAYTTAKA